MKKTAFIFIVAGLVLATVILWIISTTSAFKPFDFLQFGVILLVIGFAVFMGVRRLTSARRGEPAEDELSKKIVQKAAAWSFYISLYLWVIMIWVKDHFEWDTDRVLASGIVSMAVIFFLSWLIYNIRGIKND